MAITREILIPMKCPRRRDRIRHPSLKKAHLRPEHSVMMTRLTSPAPKVETEYSNPSALARACALFSPLQSSKPFRRVSGAEPGLAYPWVGLDGVWASLVWSRVYAGEHAGVSLLAAVDQLLRSLAVVEGFENQSHTTARSPTHQYLPARRQRGFGHSAPYRMPL
jgi:hypothetical protein